MSDNHEKRRRLDIFISSTGRDLEEHRKKVIETVLGMRDHPVNMEAFGSRPDRPLDVCLEEVAASDIFVIFLAHRYGCVPSKEAGGDGQTSMTQFELEEAQKLEKPVFAFLVDEEADWRYEKEEQRLKNAKSEEEGLSIWRAVRKLQELKTHIRTCFTCSDFTDESDLALKVQTAVTQWKDKKFGSRNAVIQAQVQSDHLNEYLDHLIEETGRIDIRGIAAESGDAEKAQSFAIEEMYTPLTTRNPVRSCERPETAGDFQGEPGDIDASVSLSSLLSEFRRLLIVGDPGGGKTTFLRYIACILAKDILNERKNDKKYNPQRLLHLGMPLDEKSPVPVLVKLTDLAEKIAKSHNVKTGTGVDAEQMTDFLKEKQGDEKAEILKRFLNKGKAVLLLDGLDEVTNPKLRPLVVKFVESILEKWGRDNIMVLTSRP